MMYLEALLVVAVQGGLFVLLVLALVGVAVLLGECL